MANRWNSGFFDREDMVRKAARRIAGMPIQPLNMPAKQNIKLMRLESEDLQRVMQNPRQRFRRMYRRRGI